MPSQRKTIILKLGRRRGKPGDLARNVCAITPASQAHLRAPQPGMTDILHDLKAPLSRLSVALGLARQQTGADAQAALDRIELEAAKLGQMLEQLLGLARAESGLKQPEEELDLLGLVKEVTADAHFEAIRFNRKVQVLPCGPCSVYAVKDMLRSAIENVVRNGVAHTAEGTSVEISVWRSRSARNPLATVSVRDHGHGVPPKMLDEIFRPFFRVLDSHDTKLVGTGLGLAIAERAVRLHGGSISAENHPEGGLIVEIQLPARARIETKLAFRSATKTVNL